MWASLARRSVSTDLIQIFDRDHRTAVLICCATRIPNECIVSKYDTYMFTNEIKKEEKYSKSLYDLLPRTKNSTILLSGVLFKSPPSTTATLPAFSGPAHSTMASAAACARIAACASLISPRFWLKTKCVFATHNLRRVPLRSRSTITMPTFPHVSTASAPPCTTRLSDDLRHHAPYQ